MQDQVSFYENISFALNLEARSNVSVAGSYSQHPGYKFTQRNGIHHLHSSKTEENLVVPNRGALVVWNWLKEAPPYRKAFYGLFHYYNKAIPNYLLLGVVTKYLDMVYPEKYSKFEEFTRQELGSFSEA